MDIALRKGRTMNRFWIAILTAVICVTLSSVGQAVYVTWWVTPAGDSMVNDITNALQVHMVGDDTGTAAVVDDGDLPASATIGQVASIEYHPSVAHGTGPTAVTAGNRVGGLANREGIPFVMGGASQYPAEDVDHHGGEWRTDGPEFSRYDWYGHESYCHGVQG